MRLCFPGVLVFDGMRGVVSGVWTWCGLWWTTGTGVVGGAKEKWQDCGWCSWIAAAAEESVALGADFEGVGCAH